MISLQSAWAMVLRHIRIWPKDFNIPLTFLYWPILDILIWGFLGDWIQQSHVSGVQNYRAVSMICLLLFQISSRGTNCLNNYFHEELHSSNIINLFSLPLSLSSWIAGCILYTALVTSLIAFICILFSLLLYDLMLSQILIAFIYFAIPLFLCSIWLGFVSLSIVTILGKRGMELAWIFAWFFTPFSGAYYPVEVLPAWGQAISSVIPMSYIFRGVRDWLINGTNPMAYLIQGYAMSFLYAVIAIALFVYCFNRCRKNGLVRLMD